MFVLKKYYEPRSVFVLKLFQTFCILLVVFLDSLNHLCKCIQLGWCVFHLKNKCLGLHIGKNKEVLQWIYVTIQWVLIWCQNKYLPSVRKKGISIFIILQFFPMVSTFAYSNIPYSGSVPHFHKKCLTEMLVLIWSLQLFYHKKVITDGYR